MVWISNFIFMMVSYVLYLSDLHMVQRVLEPMPVLICSVVGRLLNDYSLMMITMLTIWRRYSVRPNRQAFDE